MKIPLTQGRFFEEGDLASQAAPVAIIDQKFADRFWPAGAIGKQVWFNPKEKITIVGVVGAVKQYGLDIDGRIVVYRPSPFAGWHVARITGDPASVGGALARKIRELDPTITVGDIQTMTQRMGTSMARQRFSTVMLGAFAAFALILAVVGVYGVMSHLVAQGSHDIGVRMALGAERRRILTMVLRQGMELAVAGIVLGLVGAWALTRVMAGLLFNVSTMDIATFSLVPLALTVTAAMAIVIPAMRATRIDPVVALREE
jgi:ABC-type antimicrobial peptide transport system permease subunit